jgi:regulator of sigma E protease
MAAKSVGIRVNEFALGMGPKICSFRKGETKYSLRAIPIGGYCAMEGEDESSEDPKAFHNKPLLAKAFVLVAGSFMNLLAAVLILAVVVFSYGMPTTEIAAVGEGSPAEIAGMQAGDKILSIDGQPIRKWEEIAAAIQEAGRDGAQDARITVVRDGAELELESGFYAGDDEVLRIGVTPAVKKSLSNAGSSLTLGATATWNMGAAMLGAIGQIITGGASVKDLTGPVGIVKIVGDVSKNGAVQLAQLTALISLNLGLVNLLPFPALDGGRFIFLFVRKLTGRALTDEMEGKVHFVGLLLLFALMIFVTFQDITRFIL